MAAVLDYSFVNGEIDGSTGLTASKPTGTVATDLLVAVLMPVTETVGVIAPAGWTPLLSSKVEYGPDVGFFSFTAPGDVSDTTFTSAGYSWGVNIVMFRVSGVDLANPIRASATRNSDTGGGWAGPIETNDMPLPSVTAVAGDAVLSLYMQPQSDAAVGTPTAGYTRVCDVSTPHRQSFVARDNVPSGATGEISHNAAAGGWQARLGFTVAFASDTEPTYDIEYIGSATGTNTATMPAHQVGDLLLVFSYRDGNTTAPNLVSGYTNIQASGANTNSARMAYKFAASTSETVGTWTNATSVIVAVYRNVSAIGNSAITGGSSTTLTFPAVSMASSSGYGWLVGAVGHRSTNTAIATPPTNMINRVSVSDATDQAALHDTNMGRTSWTATNASVGGTASGYRSIVVELMAIPAPTLTLPSVTKTSLTSGTPSVVTDSAMGTVYMVCVPEGDVPSLVQIRAGQDSTGAPAINAQNMAVTSSGVQTFADVTGLTTGTPYDFYFSHSTVRGSSTRVMADFTPSNYPAYTPTWKTAGTGSGWTNSGNTTASDNAYAVGTTTGWFAMGPTLNLSNFNFDLPEGVTLKEVRYRIEGYHTTTAGVDLDYDSFPFVWVSGSNTSSTIRASSELVGRSKSVVEGVWPASEFAGVSLSDFNSSSFGIRWNAPGTSGNAFDGGTITTYVDRIELMWVDNGPPPDAPPSAALFWAFP